MTETPAHTALWPAPHASGAVTATVHVPGSKSVTNRALVLAALAAEPGWLRRPLRWMIGFGGVSMALCTAGL
ncbi:hypothetical protein ABZ366_03605, partial [Streptomyces sp. NPDC005904]